MPFAREHWEFAWLSVAAYQGTRAGAKHVEKVKAAQGIGADVPDPAQFLGAVGWRRWEDFPDDGLLTKISESHLRVEVWERQDPPAVAVTFGGTVFNNDADRRANLRWFLPGKHKDEYTDVVQRFAPAFDLELKRRAVSCGTAKLYRRRKLMCRCAAR